MPCPFPLSKIYNPGLDVASGSFFKSHKGVLPRSVIWKSNDVYKVVDASDIRGVCGRVFMKCMSLHINYIFIIYNISSITKCILCLLMQEEYFSRK